MNISTETLLLEEQLDSQGNIVSQAIRILTVDVHEKILSSNLKPDVIDVTDLTIADAAINNDTIVLKFIDDTIDKTMIKLISYRDRGTPSQILDLSAEHADRKFNSTVGNHYEFLDISKDSDKIVNVCANFNSAYDTIEMEIVKFIKCQGGGWDITVTELGFRHIYPVMDITFVTSKDDLSELVFAVGNKELMIFKEVEDNYLLIHEDLSSIEPAFEENNIQNVAVNFEKKEITIIHESGIPDYSNPRGCPTGLVLLGYDFNEEPHLVKKGGIAYAPKYPNLSLAMIDGEIQQILEDEIVFREDISSYAFVDSPVDKYQAVIVIGLKEDGHMSVYLPNGTRYQRYQVPVLLTDRENLNDRIFSLASDIHVVD